MAIPTDLSHMTDKEVRHELWSEQAPFEVLGMPAWAAEQIISLPHLSGELQAMAFESLVGRDEEE